MVASPEVRAFAQPARSQHHSVETAAYTVNQILPDTEFTKRAARTGAVAEELRLPAADGIRDKAHFLFG